MSDAEEVCRTVYQETRAFYDATAPKLGASANGFRVLYGPPTVGAPILFLGYQPGGSKPENQVAGEREGWPKDCDYAVAKWTLALRIQEMWGAELLRQCTGLNAIFFRSPTMRTWRSQEMTGLREEIELFSRQRAEKIIRVLVPKSVVVIGLATFDMLTEGVTVLSGDKPTLVKQGALWGIPAYGVVHLSGARISRGDRARLKAFFTGGLLGEGGAPRPA